VVTLDTGRFADKGNNNITEINKNESKIALRNPKYDKDQT